MSDTKISALSPTTTVSSTDALPIARGGSNFQLSVNQIFNYVGQNAIPIPTLQSPAKTGTSANIQNTSLSVDGRVLLGGGTAGANGNTILGGSTIAGNVAITGVTNTASGVLYTKAQTPLTTTLVSTITATETTSITIADGTNFPTSGSVVIDNETISYTGLTSGTLPAYTLSGVTRGASSSAASAHTASAVIASTATTSATLNGILTQGATSIAINGTFGLSYFPTSGVVLIDNEQISYTGKSAATGSGNLTGCTRGYNGTIDVAHASAAAVILAPIVASDNSYTYNASTGRLAVPYVQATGVTTSAVATSSISAPNSTVTAMSIDSAGVVTGGSVNLSLQQQVYQQVGASSPNAPSASTYFQWTIPSWAKKITIMFSGVSNSGTATTDIPLIQLGYGGTPTYLTSGYLGCVSEFFSSTNLASAQLSSSSGFATSFSQAATYVRHGIATLTNVGGTKWVYSCNLGLSDSLRTSLGGGSVDLGNALTAVKVTTQNNTSTFSAGTINLLVE